MNTLDESKLEKFSKELSILHYAVTFGSFMVTVLLYFFTVEDGHFNFSDTGDYFLFICPILAMGGVFGGDYLYKNKMNEIKSMNSIDEILYTYRAAKVLKFALIEGPALICALAMMPTQNLLYLVIGLILIAYLFSHRISKNRIEEELSLT